MCSNPGKSRPAWGSLDRIRQWRFVLRSFISTTITKRKLTIFFIPKCPCSQKAIYCLIFCHGFSRKDLRSSKEESHVVKIENPSEQSKKSERGVAHGGAAGQTHCSLLRAVGFLTGEMKEYRNWLKGRRMPREEVAGSGLGDSLLGKPPLHSLMVRVPTVGVLQLRVDFGVGITYPTNLKFPWLEN